MDLTTEPDPSTGIQLSLPTGFSFDAFTAFSGSYSQDSFDEIRIGDNFSAVVGE
jgi:hypothetical protein